MSEVDAVRQRYARRRDADPRYAPTRPEVIAERQERERVTAALLRSHGWSDLRALRLLEVGCGTGQNLLDFLRLGACPASLVGVELLEARAQAARERLPLALRVHTGDAAAIDLGAARFDIVMQATVFSSLLDAGFRRRLADAMWHWTAPGGAVLWYDLVVDNPLNPDVRGVPAQEVRALFAQAASVQIRRVTLAPPLARALARLHPGLMAWAHAVVPLRTHLLAWIEKPR